MFRKTHCAFVKYNRADKTHGPKPADATWCCLFNTVDICPFQTQPAERQWPSLLIYILRNASRQNLKASECPQCTSSVKTQQSLGHCAAAWKAKVEWHTTCCFVIFALNITVTTLWMKCNHLQALRSHKHDADETLVDLLAHSILVKHSDHLHSSVY